MQERRMCHWKIIEKFKKINLNKNKFYYNFPKTFMWFLPCTPVICKEYNEKQY